MNKQLIEQITKYVEEHIEGFHDARLEKLRELDLKKLLARKNPYMFKAKHIVKASEMVEDLASAFMSSAEESIFGNWMEGLAIYIAKCVYHGHKSVAKGLDLEFDMNNKHYLVSIKSGPYWGNSSSIAKLKDYFKDALKVQSTSGNGTDVVCVEGCCYGNDNKDYEGILKADHLKCCGEKFWTLISGEPTLFVDIIEPLGTKAKEKNEEYYAEYGRMINKATQQFIDDYCFQDGSINWEKIVRLNASVKVPKEPKVKKEAKSPAKKSKKSK